MYDRRKGAGRAENTFEDVITKNFSNLERKQASYLKSTKSSKQDQKRIISRYVVIKTPKIEEKENTKRREIKQVMYKGNSHEPMGLNFQQKLCMPEDSGIIFLE